MSTKKNNELSEGKKKTVYTIKLTLPQIKQLDVWCSDHGWSRYDVDYAHYGYKGDRVNLVAYESGKLVIQGQKMEEFVRYVLEAEITKKPEMGYEAVNHPEWFEAHAGLDESGKGDLFGPLVAACVIADKEMVQEWMNLGIKDSKLVTNDAEVIRMDKIIRSTGGVVVKTAFAGMSKYNELYHKFGSNLNKLLAWMHSKALSEALKVRKVPWGMLDQFSKAPLVQNYFKNTDFDLKMQTKAEADPVVAAASIVARAEYVRQMRKLSDLFGEPLLKGASAKVKQQAKDIIAKQGPEALGSYAKLHFKTAYEALGIPVPKTN